MSKNNQNSAAKSEPARSLTPAAQRALAEAEQRRQQAAAAMGPSSGTGPAEQGGRAGPEPTRFGDWERNGIVSDF